MHAHGAAIAAIDAFDFAGDQAVADIVQAGAALVFGQGRAEHAELGHFVVDITVEGLVAVGQEHTRHKLALAIFAGGVTHHAFFFGQLVVEEEGVIPLELVGHFSPQSHRGHRERTGREMRIVGSGLGASRRLARTEFRDIWFRVM